MGDNSVWVETDHPEFKVVEFFRSAAGNGGEKFWLVECCMRHEVTE